MFDQLIKLPTPKPLAATLVALLFPFFLNAQDKPPTTNKSKPFFHVSIDDWDDASGRLVLGSRLISEKFYPELNASVGFGALNLGGSWGKIFSRKPYDGSKSFGWHFNFFLSGKVNLFLF